MMTDTVIADLAIDRSKWKTVQLGDVVEESREVVRDPVKEGIERVVGLEHLDSESIHLRRWDTLEQNTTFTKKFTKGQVLFGRRRAYLKKAALSTFDGICSGDVTVLQAKPGLIPELLPFLINNDKFFDYAVKNSAGSLSPRAKFKDLANYEFLLPPKDQQARLAELLWAADEIMINYSKVLTRIENIFKIIHKQLFELKFDSNFFDGIPVSSFKKVKLEDVCSESMFGPRFSSDLYSPTGNIATLRTTDIDDEGNINLSTMPKAALNRDEFSKHFLLKNDLLITRSGTCGIATVFPGYDLPVIPGAFLIRFRLYKDVNPYYFSLFFNSEIGRNDTSKLATGAVQKNLTSVSLLNMEIPVPPIEIQDKIVERLNTLRLKPISKSIELMKQLQKSLVNQIF